MDKPRRLILILILLLAAALRFYNFSDWSLSNDELSSWLRLQYSSLSEVLTEGVRPDFHPAGVQVFMYYWIKIAGDSPFALRLPSVIFGILGVWMTFMVGRKWFGVNAGLMAAAAMCFLQLPLLYSQIARPYSSGMLFALCMVYFWTNVVFSSKTSDIRHQTSGIRNGIGYGIFTALCMYDHYFCFMLAGLVGITGLFFLDKDNWKVYLLSGFGALVLFLPHLGISIEQLSRGGLESWLGPPEDGYLGKFILYCVHDNLWLGIGMLVLAITPFFIKTLDRRITRFHIISISWFAVIYFIGYFYSLYVSPVLQYSVLIFAFPFLILFLFSFYGEGNTKTVTILGSTLVTAGIYIVTLGTGFYSKQQFGVFKELAEKTKEWDEKYGKDSLSIFYNTIAPEYIEYYYKQLDCQIDFEFCRGDDPKFISSLQKAVSESKSKYFVYGWSNNRHPDEALSIIKLNFPKVLAYQNYLNSQIILFSKERGEAFCFENKILIQPLNIPFDKAQVEPRDSVLKSIIIDKDQEYYNLFSIKLDTFIKQECAHVVAFYAFDKINRMGEHLLVAEIKRKDSTILWKGADLKVFNYSHSDGAYVLSLPIRISKNYLPSDEIKFYIWNKDRIESRPQAFVLRMYPEYNTLIYD